MVTDKAGLDTRVLSTQMRLVPPLDRGLEVAAVQLTVAANLRDLHLVLTAPAAEYLVLALSQSGHAAAFRTHARPVSGQLILILNR